ncbi:MAG: 7-carboxy-7-deazaguanine synthase QueE [Planctomycetaceae bacterium]|nr:7-carboxy-7-deazaguanine synthase QueE [Planctomycetaceae bacterium]
MLISEIFESIQGEGPWSGTRSLFIRTSGCNLRCWFCDTPYTSWQAEGVQYSLEQLCDVVAASESPDVVLTGGEPMLVNDLVPLSRHCRELGKRVTIETAGTVDLGVECDLMAISPKLKNSIPVDAIWGSRHDRTRHQPDVLRALVSRYNAVFKFVIDSPEDLQEARSYLDEFPEIQLNQIWLMPQARDRDQLAEKSEWLKAAAIENGFQYSSRLHIELFGNRRGI